MKLQLRLTAASFLVGIAFTCLMAGSDVRAAGAELVVSGLVSHPLHLSMGQLRSLASKEISVSQLSEHGPVKLDCKGAPIASLLAKANPTWGPKRNAALAHVVLVSAIDGYAVALSLGEIDKNFGSADPIIAVQCNGKTLEMPRLVVSGDKHAGRAVRDVTSIEVR